MDYLPYIIILGVAIVIGALVLESTVAKRKNLKIYRLSDSVVNLSCGMMERVFDFFLSVLILFGFHFIWTNYAPYQIPTNIGTWLIALVVFDCIAYWFHRLSHEINFLWAAHIVHHQSEELNLTTVFRASFFAVIFRAFFFVWMAFAGFDAFTIATCSLTLGLFQLFTHSRVIGKLGVFEKFLTTPSHHRVHHARNEKYMDHNYSHIFIIWDRIFGTFIIESEEPDYGITTGFESANAYNAAFSYWRNLFTRASRTKKIKDKIKVFTKGPAWTPNDVPHLPNEYKTDKKGKRLHHKMPVGVELGAYVLLNVAITFGAFVALMLLYKVKLDDLTGLSTMAEAQETLANLFFTPQVLALVGVILISIFAHARMLEQTKSSVYFDAFRLVAVGTLIFTAFHSTPYSIWLTPLTFSLCGLMFLWLMKLRIQRTLKIS